jgi:hypothetical protein
METKENPLIKLVNILDAAGYQVEAAKWDYGPHQVGIAVTVIPPKKDTSESS